MQKLFYFVVHFLFWTAFIAISWLTVSASPEEMAFIYEHKEVPFLLLIWGGINFYSFYFYFQPLLLDTRKYTRYLLFSIIYAVVVSALVIAVFWLFYPAFRDIALQKLMESTVGTFLISQSGSLLRGFVSWNKNLQKQTILENESLRNELGLLKAQLSPHFLFNTLNNIDTLIYRSQDEASAMLIKLAALLRYMLYESDGKEVPIEREIDYISQLTELQRLRFEKPDFIELAVENKGSQVKIAPLLFLPFVENAFKHVSSSPDMPAIVIRLTVTDEEVQLTCKNHFRPKTQGEGKQHSGIGLANARRRLALLYPDRFDLEVTEHLSE